jgi:branched-chain amino acid aminotransferase
MEKAIGEYFFSGKNRYPVSDFHHQTGKNQIYEVIRIADGIPLFLEDHLIRMNESLALVHAEPIRSLEEVRNLILKLVKANRVESGNVKLIIGNELEDDILIYLIPFCYPDRSMYAEGVHTGTLQLERKNPNAKVINTGYKEQVTRFIEESGIYEAILVNRDGQMTEGSRSNLFFVLDDVLVTPPLHDVLGGITRKKVIELATRNGIPFREDTLSVDDIRRLSGVFLTGTSPKILPIRSIDAITIPSTGCAIIRQLMTYYDEEIRSYLKRET